METSKQTKARGKDLPQIPEANKRTLLIKLVAKDNHIGLLKPPPQYPLLVHARLLLSQHILPKNVYVIILDIRLNCF